MADKKTLLLDVDGVLRNTVDPVLKIYKRDFDIHSHAEHDDVKTYSMQSVCPRVSDLAVKFFYPGKYAKEIFSTGKPYEKNISSTIKKISKKFNIHIVTHQYMGNESITIDWLIKHDIYYDNITFSSDKTVVRGDYIIDDKTSNLIDINLKCHGVIPIAYDQPWNKDWIGKRIKTLDQFINQYSK